MILDVALLSIHTLLIGWLLCVFRLWTFFNRIWTSFFWRPLVVPVWSFQPDVSFNDPHKIFRVFMHLCLNPFSTVLVVLPARLVG